MSFVLFSLLLHYYLLNCIRLSSGQDNTVTPASYPTQVPGTCGAAGTTNVFDCGADNGGCIPFSDVRDCKNDCTNGTDELCGTGLTLCDVNVYGDAYKCGKCVGALVATCLDRRFQFICTDALYHCATTLNCVLDDWLIDGSNECGDWSDENRCIHNVTKPGTYPCVTEATCSFTANDTTPTTTCTCPSGMVGNGLIAGTGCSIPLTTTTPVSTTTSTTTTTTSTSTSPTTSTTTTTSTSTSSTSTTTTTPTTTVATTATTTTTPVPTTTSSPTTSTSTTSSSTTTTITTTTATLSPCVDQFQCVQGGCLPDSKVLNGAFDCPTAGDTSDETYCETVLTTCPAAPSNNQCAYSWSTHEFACGCADNLTLPSLNKICIARNASRLIGAHWKICNRRIFNMPQLTSFINLPENCADIVLKNPDALNGIETLYDLSCHTPSSPACNFAVYCDQNTSQGGWTVMLRRVNGTTNFDRTYDEYAAGFGPMENDDFYIGNTLANFMTSNLPYQLLVYGIFQGSNSSFMVFYNLFTVASEQEGFTMQVDKEKEQFLANDLLQSNKLNFSAKDVGPVTGCASTRKGGWWWTESCNPSGGVLTVPLEASPFDVNINGVFWGQKQLSAVAMLLRPVGYIPPPGKEDPTLGSDGSRCLGVLAFCAASLLVVILDS